MRTLFGAVLGAALVALHPSPGSAQSACGERADFIAFLGEKFAEQPVAMGLTSAGTVIELLTSSSGTWTILITYPNGTTCLAAAGEYWETLPPSAAGQVS
ncbi:MAG: hypothetical protein ACE5LF_09010 [Alphaproteobacteria bacterium]